MLLRSLLLLCVAFSCVTENHSAIWPCSSSADCTAVNSLCSPTTGKCECKFGFVFSSNYEKCLATALYEGPCEDTTQCNHMPTGAVCKQGKCACDNGYVYVRGKCRLLSGLGSGCKDDADCYFGYDRNSVACEEGKCACANGYYQRYENICRKKATALKDACVVNEDCDQVGNGAKCESYECVSAGSPETPDTRKTFKETAAQTSLDYYQLKPLSDITTDEYDVECSKATSNDDDEKTAKYGDACKTPGKPCNGLSHSVCVDSVCYCQFGYYQKNGKCFAELGEVAADENTCEFELDQRRVCSCVKNYFYETSLRACKKPITFDLSCTSNSQCSPYGAAYCHPVVPRRCRCLDIAQMDEKSQMCVHKQGLGAACETNAGCSIPLSYCSPEKVCSCQAQHIEKNGSCVKAIGAECAENQDCETENAVCEPSEPSTTASKSCQCRKGFVHFKDECLKEATELGDDCTESEQCKPLLGTCLDKKCSCKDTQHYNYGKCEQRKSIGDSCSRAGECFMPAGQDRVECRNSVCACQTEYKHDVEKHVCVPKPRKNSSGRPSVLKIITFLLIGSAFVITTAALKQAYY